MTRISGAARFTLLLAAFALFIFISATGLGPVTRLGPLVVAAPTLAIILYQFRRDLAAPRAPDDHAASAGRERTGLLWILLFPLMLLPLGFQVAIPLYTLLFLRLRGQERWPRTLAMTAASAVLIYSLSLLTSRPELIEAPLWNWLTG